MNKAVIDTDIFSEIFTKRNKTVVKKAEGYYQAIGYYTITILTFIEILKGLYQESFKALDKAPWEEKITRFLAAAKDWEILNLDLESCQIGAKIRGYLDATGVTIGKSDPLIAAIAIKYGLTLVTGNTEHFQRIQDLGYPLPLDNWRG